MNDPKIEAVNFRIEQERAAQLPGYQDRIASLKEQREELAEEYATFYGVEYKDSHHE